MEGESSYFERRNEISSLEEALRVIAALEHSLEAEREARRAALRQKEEIEEEAKHDSLLKTMLNQGATMERLEACVHENKPFGVFYVDIDRFKKFNDTYGHGAGNELLLLLEELLQENFRRATDNFEVGRVGGDEFLLIMAELKQGGRRSSDFEEQMQNIRELILRDKVEAGLYVRDPRTKEAGIGLSIGSAFFHPEQPISAPALKERADKALYLDKRTRRGDEPDR
jgi:diguanylate cyclase (GGDEF)-like protein